MTAHHSSASRAIVRLIRHPLWWQVSSSFRCPLYSSLCPQGTDIFSRFRLVFPAEQYSRFIHLQNYFATFIFLLHLLSKSFQVLPPHKPWFFCKDQGFVMCHA